MDRTRQLGSADRRARELGPGDAVGDWAVVRRLARGGFATVYEVRHRQTGAPAALKLLHAHLVRSPEMVARFEREVQVIGQVRHPNVVELVAAGFSEDDRPYLCMELLEGEDLAHVLARRGRLSLAEALAVLEPLCDALAVAHQLGIVHRDVKVSNVFVCRAEAGAAEAAGLGRVVLLDFGIAKLSDALAPELTASHQTIGTPVSMAPEQIAGRAVDARTDVYALGALLFQVLTGRVPFEDPSPTMTQYLHVHARRPRVSALAPVPPSLDEVVIRAMAIAPADRFADPRSLLAAVRAALRHTAVVAAAREVDAVVILVAAEPAAGAALDDALLTDVEAVLPAAERFLVGRGYALAADLGSTALFVKHDIDPSDAVADAIAAWDGLSHRAGRDPRARIAIGVHRGPATLAGAELRAGALLRAGAWNLPEPIEGVWVTSAIDPVAPRGRRIR